MKKPIGKDFEKLWVLIMALAMLAIIVALPIPAHAECGHGHWDKARQAEVFDQRMKTLHDVLKLSDSQEGAWHDFIGNLKPGERPLRMERSELSKLPTPERLDRMLSMMKERLQNMESHTQAVKSFYAQLTAQQQKIFDEKFRPYGGDHEKR